MASGLFGSWSKETIKKEAPPPNNLLKILTANELLIKDRYKVFLTELPSLSALGKQEYEILYLKTIYNFVEFVQRLPHTTISYYSYPGGLLDHALDRCYRALKLSRAYLLGAESANTTLSQQQLLWIYAIFTAALLLDIGHVVTKIQVTLCNAKGGAIKDWLFSKGPMTQQSPATHYRYEFLPQNWRRLKNLMTPMVARQLLPNSGFNWLASDKTILEAWMAILSDDQSGGGVMPMIIPLADAQSIDAYWNQKRAAANLTNTTDQMPEDFMQLFTAITDTNPLNAVDKLSEDAHVTQALAGEAFLNWLRKSLEKQTLNMNQADSLVHRVADGSLVILPQAFNEFLKNNPQFKDVSEVARQFSMLEITGKQETFRQYLKDENTKIVNNAFKIPNVYHLVDPKKSLPSTSPYLLPLGNLSIDTINNWVKPVITSAMLPAEPPKPAPGS